VQNLTYSFNTASGNLAARQDNLNNLTEIFGYDQESQLKEIIGPESMTMSYAGNGSIKL